jgi:hypothetical protein
MALCGCPMEGQVCVNSALQSVTVACFYVLVTSVDCPCLNRTFPDMHDSHAMDKCCAD